MVGEKIQIYLLQMAKISLKYPPWMEEDRFLSCTRCRSSENKYFKINLEKVRRNAGSVIVNSIDVNSSIKIVLQASSKPETMDLGQEFKCGCRKHHKTRNTITCWHIVWCLRNIFSFSDNDNILPEVSINLHTLEEVRKKVSLTIHQHLREFSNIADDRAFHEKLKAHKEFNKSQEWTLSRKFKGKPCRCSGCLLPNMIRVNYLNLSVKGLL